MGVHRFRCKAADPAELVAGRQVLNGGTINNALPDHIDITLVNDADLPDLQAYLLTLGLEFVESNPTFPPFDWRQNWTFSQVAVALPLLTDVFFGLSGAALGTIGVGLGIGGDLLPTRAGRVQAVNLRSTAGVTVDVFVIINGGRTVIGNVVLPANAVTPVPLVNFPAWANGNVVQMGVQNQGILANVSLTAGVEIQWG